MAQLNPWSRYIIQKGIFLSALFLISSLILSVWQAATPLAFPLLQRFAQHYQSASATVLAATSLGGLFLEDILRNS